MPMYWTSRFSSLQEFPPALDPAFLRCLQQTLSRQLKKRKQACASATQRSRHNQKLTLSTTSFSGTIANYILDWANATLKRFPLAMYFQNCVASLQNSSARSKQFHSKLNIGRATKQSVIAVDRRYRLSDVCSNSFATA